MTRRQLQAGQVQGVSHEGLQSVPKLNALDVKRMRTQGHSWSFRSGCPGLLLSRPVSVTLASAPSSHWEHPLLGSMVGFARSNSRGVALFSYLKGPTWDLPAGPVVKALGFQWKRGRFDP